MLDTENSRNRYRGRLEIIRDILLVVEDRSCRKTRIMYGANLSYKLLAQYLDEIILSGLIQCDGNSWYMITDKGKRFLELYVYYEKTFREVKKGMTNLENGKETLNKMLSS